MPDINFERYKPFLSYVIGFISFVILVYLSIPFFFNYSNYGPELERKILENFSLRTSVKGEIKYKFLPYPTLEVRKIEINDFKKSKPKWAIFKKRLRENYEKKLYVYKLFNGQRNDLCFNF